MARITVPGFTGVVRITAPQRLEDHQAQYALDCDFRSTDLRPYYGDKASTTYTGTFATAYPASMFLYDQGKLIVQAGDYSFARSPVFLLDSGNDKRVFFSEFASNNNSFPMVLESMAGPTAPLPTDAKRLGVPQPGEMNDRAISLETQSGTITTFQIRTASDGYITVPKTEVDSANLEKGDRILLDAPGYVLGQSLRIKAIEPEGAAETATHYKLTLENDQRKWKLGALVRTNGETTLQFKLNNHGFSDDDQVFFSHNKNTDGSTRFPPGVNLDPVDLARPFRVVNATYDRFELQYYADGWTTLELKEKWTGDTGAYAPGGETVYKKVALLASYTQPLPDGAFISVSLGGAPNKPYEAVADYNFVSAEVEALWANAATADIVADRAYCVTFVNAYGDESAPSLPTKPMSVVPGSPVTFKYSGIPTDASGVWVGEPLIDKYLPPVEIRLYRTDALGTFRLVTTDSTVAGSTSPYKILFSAAQAADFTYEDTALDSALGEPLATTGWSVPALGMVGLVNAPNGVVAGFRGRTIFGSVPYAPYAWPISNQVATDYDVVGLVPTSAGLVVVTKGMPAILIGDNPANWTMQKLEYPQGCVARRSIVDMGEFAMYASPDGLVAIAGANVEILTKSIMTREQWQAYNPSSITATQSEGRYIATYLKDGVRQGFIYDPQTQSFTDLSLNAVAFCNDLLNDVLLMLGPADGRIYEWNQDTTTFKPFTWTSKWFQLPIPELMGVAQIFTTTTNLTGRNLTFVLHGYDNNGVTKIYEISTASNPDAILGNRPFRLPYVPPGRFTGFQVTLAGSIPVGTVMVGRTMDEMKLAP